MMPDEADSIAERATLLAAQQPTIREALACEDCFVIFRSGGECPRCGSSSLWNVAKFLGMDKLQ